MPQTFLLISRFGRVVCLNQEALCEKLRLELQLAQVRETSTTVAAEAECERLRRELEQVCHRCRIILISLIFCDQRS